MPSKQDRISSRKSNPQPMMGGSENGESLEIEEEEVMEKVGKKSRTKGKADGKEAFHHRDANPTTTSPHATGVVSFPSERTIKMRELKHRLKEKRREQKEEKEGGKSSNTTGRKQASENKRRRLGEAVEGEPTPSPALLDTNADANDTAGFEGGEERKKRKKPLVGGKSGKREAAGRAGRGVKSWEKLAMVQPNYALDRERERRLARMATSGVTQLFNAIANRQRFLEGKLKGMAGKGRKQRRETMAQLRAYDFETAMDAKDNHLSSSSSSNPRRGGVAKTNESAEVKEDIKEEGEDDGYDYEPTLMNATFSGGGGGGKRGRKAGLTGDEKEGSEENSSFENVEESSENEWEKLEEEELEEEVEEA